jgi:hypothetical protein
MLSKNVIFVSVILQCLRPIDCCLKSNEKSLKKIPRLTADTIQITKKSTEGIFSIDFAHVLDQSPTMSGS